MSINYKDYVEQKARGNVWVEQRTDSDGNTYNIFIEKCYDHQTGEPLGNIECKIDSSWFTHTKNNVEKSAAGFAAFEADYNDPIVVP